MPPALAKRLLPALILFIASLTFFLYQITRNRVPFHADEMYWIGTGRVVTMILSGNLHDPFWDEFGGYANFNGAKWIYGTGMILTGHRDLSFIGYPPEIYYHYAPLENAVLSESRPEYPLVRDARIISAVFGSASIAIMGILAFDMTQSWLMALIAGAVLAMHPVVRDISTVAFADTFFLFFQLIAVYLMERYYAVQRQKSTVIAAYIGITVAILTAIKLNGLWFAVVAAVYVVLRYRRTPAKIPNSAGPDILVGMITFFCAFWILHPNFFFYPSNGPIRIISERIAITRYQMQFFSVRDQQHVLWTIPARLISFWHGILGGSYFWLSVSVVIPLIGFLIRRYRDDRFTRLTLCMALTFASLMGYVVFDEPRYFLPVLPYLILVCILTVQKISSTPVDKSVNVAHHRL